MTHRRISLSPDPADREERRAVEHDGQPRPALLRVFPLADHVEEEQEGPVVDPRQTWPEASAEPLLFVFALNEFRLRFPFHPEGRVGEHVVELLVFEMVRREAVAEAHVVDFVALDHQVGPADGIGLRVEVLAEHLQPRVRIELAKVILGDGQHAARPARRVEQRADRPLRGQDVGVRQEQKIDHQPDHLARGEVIARLLVRRLVEPPDQLLEDGAHLEVGDLVRVQVDLAEPLHHEVEPVGLVELGDVLLEAEVVEDLPRAVREALHVMGQVGGDVVRVALQLGEGEPARVVERHAGNPAQDRVRPLELAALEALELVEDFVLGRFQHAVEPSQDGHREHDVLVLVRPVRAAQQLRDRPDEADLLALIHGTSLRREIPVPGRGPPATR